MRYKLWIASLWPGCWHAWRGEVRGLALAVGFAVALNTSLVLTIGLLPVGNDGLTALTTRVVPWLFVIGLWLYGLVWLRWNWAASAQSSEGSGREEADAQFHKAQHEYLRGHWLEAETLLANLLRENSCDVEARLLLGSVQRRTTRWNEARQTLLRLHDDGTAGQWRLEIETELARIDELESVAQDKLHEESNREGEWTHAA